MEYSPRNANPYISRVDAGTVELVRSFGAEVVPSGDLVGRFESTWDDEQWAMHQEAARVCRAAYDVAFGLIAERVRRDGSVMETEVQQAILDHFAGQRPDHRRPADRRRRPAQRRPPLRDHPRDRRPDPARATSSSSTSGPRSTTPGRSTPITRGSASSARPCPTVTRTSSGSSSRPGTPGSRWSRQAFAARPAAPGAGGRRRRPPGHRGGRLRPAFNHRTGHNIGQDDHGNGAHLDNLETRDDRLIIPRTCFSIEPGIYLPEFGVRTEVDVFIDAEGKVHVTGGEPQARVLPILA